MKKYVILGVARSGTTIVSIFFHSLPNSFCFIEPHFEYQYEKTTYQIDEMSKYGVYDTTNTMPINGLISSMLTNYDMVGFKETFRGNARKNEIGRGNSTLYNRDFLEVYKDNNYEFIYVIRNPVEACGSMILRQNRKILFSPKIQETVNIFIKNFHEFVSEFIKDSRRVIFYDNFCDSPVETVRKIVPELHISDVVILKEMSDKKIGDTRALKSKIVDKNHNKTNLHEKYLNQIIKSEAFEDYKTLRNRIA